MRFAIPSDDRAHVAGHMGRCQGFLIFDAEGDHAVPVEYRDNPRRNRHQQRLANPQMQHNQADGHDDFLSALADCEAIIALGMGPRLSDDLQNHGIKVFFTRDVDATRVANLLASGAFASHPSGSACNHQHH